GDVVVAGAAIDGQRGHEGGQARGADHIGAAEALDGESVRGFGGVHVHLRVQADNRVAAAGAEDLDVVRGVGPVNDDAVRRPVLTPRGRGEVHVELRQARAAQVIDGDGVGAPQDIEVHALDVGEVHDDVAEVARQMVGRADS